MSIECEKKDDFLRQQSEESLVTVTVILMGELKRWAGRREVEIELPEGSTLQMLAQKLGSVCGPAFAQKVLTKKRSFQPHVAVFINGVHAGELESAQTILRSGKIELMLLPSYEGG